jgi:hypothetical protein
MVAIFDPALYENFTIEKEWVRLRAKNALLWVNRGHTGLASTVLVAGSVGALMFLAPPAVAAATRRATATAATAAAAVSALALGIRTVGGVWIRHHRNSCAQLGDLLIAQLQ